MAQVNAGNSILEAAVHLFFAASLLPGGRILHAADAAHREGAAILHHHRHSGGNDRNQLAVIRHGHFLYHGRGNRRGSGRVIPTGSCG